MAAGDTKVPSEMSSPADARTAEKSKWKWGVPLQATGWCSSLHPTLRRARFRQGSARRLLPAPQPVDGTVGWRLEEVQHPRQHRRPVDIIHNRHWKTAGSPAATSAAVHAGVWPVRLPRGGPSTTRTCVDTARVNTPG